jgi:hypothetical protein
MGARGYVAARCEICATEEQLAHAKECATEIPKLEAKLAELRAKE